MDVGDMQPTHRPENMGITIHMVWPKVSKFVGGVEVTVQ